MFSTLPTLTCEGTGNVLCKVSWRVRTRAINEVGWAHHGFVADVGHAVQVDVGASSGR